MNFTEALIQTDCDTSARLHDKMGDHEVQLVVSMTMEGLQMNLFLKRTNSPEDLISMDILEWSFLTMAEYEINQKQIAHFIAHAMKSSKWEVY